MWRLFYVNYSFTFEHVFYDVENIISKIQFKSFQFLTVLAINVIDHKISWRVDLYPCFYFIIRDLFSQYPLGVCLLEVSIITNDNNFVSQPFDLTKIVLFCSYFVLSFPKVVKIIQIFCASPSQYEHKAEFRPIQRDKFDAFKGSLTQLFWWLSKQTRCLYDHNVSRPSCDITILEKPLTTTDKL